MNSGSYGLHWAVEQRPRGGLVFNVQEPFQSGDFVLSFLLGAFPASKELENEDDDEDD